MKVKLESNITTAGQLTEPLMKLLSAGFVQVEEEPTVTIDPASVSLSEEFIFSLTDKTLAGKMFAAVVSGNKEHLSKQADNLRKKMSPCQSRSQVTLQETSGMLYEFFGEKSADEAKALMIKPFLFAGTNYTWSCDRLLLL